MCICIALSSVQLAKASVELELLHTFEGHTEGYRTVDMNSDGLLDFVFYSDSDSTFYVRYYEAPAALSEKVVLYKFDKKHSVSNWEVGDINGDEILDLVAKVYIYPDHKILGFLRDVSGTVTTRTLVDLSDSSSRIPPQFNDLADIDGDSDLDILLYLFRAGEVSVLRNDGTAEFTLDPEFPELINLGHMDYVDFDNDGYVDIVSTGPAAGEFVLQVLYGSAQNSWERIVYEGIPSWYYKSIGDFNRDGAFDIVTERDNVISYYVQDSPRSLRLQNRDTLTIYDPSTGNNFDVLELKQVDLNLDGYPEIIVRTNHFYMWLYCNSEFGLMKAQPQEYYWSEMEVDINACISMDIDQDKFPELILGNYIKTTVWKVSGSTGLLSGSVSTELSGDCSDDEQVYSLAAKVIEIEPGGHRALTDSEGHYGKFLPFGDYSVKVSDEPFWYTDCSPAERSIALTEENRYIENLDFARNSTDKEPRLSVSLASSRFRPGRAGEYILSYTNVGALPFSGIVSLNFDETLEEVQFSRQPQSSGAGFAEWEIQSLPTGAAGQFSVKFVVPRAAMRGDELCARAAAELQSDNPQSQDNLDELCTEVTGSYDPNDIRVWPRGTAGDGRITGDVNTLAYMIRFQNTGNDTAFTVVVRDTLPAELDVRRLRFGATSHAYSVDLLNNNILEFRFDDIYLPDSTTDLLGSQGFIKFRIDMQSGLDVGTQIRNRAGIYFDFNDVVLTNAAVTEIIAGTSESDPTARLGKLLSQPNPVDGRVTVAGIPADVHTLEVSDVQGRIIMRIKTEGATQRSFDCSGLAPAAYLVRTRGGVDSREVQINVVR